MRKLVKFQSLCQLFVEKLHHEFLVQELGSGPILVELTDVLEFRVPGHNRRLYQQTLIVLSALGPAIR